ncbi:MAG: hypothetical protein ACLPV4_11325 [Solirubrobacteraceae bacterium]
MLALRDRVALVLGLIGVVALVLGLIGLVALVLALALLGLLEDPQPAITSTPHTTTTAIDRR